MSTDLKSLKEGKALAEEELEDMRTWYNQLKEKSAVEKTDLQVYHMIYNIRTIKYNIIHQNFTVAVSHPYTQE